MLCCRCGAAFCSCCLRAQLPWLSFCYTSRELRFLPCRTQGGGRMAMPWLARGQIQRAFRRGNFAEDCLGTTLCGALRVYQQLQNVETLLLAKDTCSRAADPGAWVEGRQAPLAGSPGPSDATGWQGAHAGGAEPCWGPCGCSVQMPPSLTHPSAPCGHLFPWDCIPCPCYLQQCQHRANARTKTQ